MTIDTPAILLHINTCRARLGKPPVETIERGRISGDTTCPVAASINLGEGTRQGTASVIPQDTALYEHGLKEDPEIIAHLPAVQEFVRAFDAGKLPEYVSED